MVLGTCQPGRDVGVGEPCNDSAIFCGAGLICRETWVNPDGGIGEMGRCELKALGAACVWVGDCPPPSYCEGPADGGARVCVAAHEGSPCTVKADCLPEHYCEQSQTCRPPRQEGEQCDEGQFKFRCDSRLACASRGTEWVCYRQRDLSESCDPAVAAPCMYPLGCADGRCGKVEAEPARAEGESCVVDRECASLRCFLERCQAPCP